jgi:hypothetical protein
MTNNTPDESIVAEIMNSEQNPNHISSVSCTPLKTILALGNQKDVCQLIKLGADPRVHNWLYSKNEIKIIKSIFGNEFDHPAVSEEAQSLRKTPSIGFAKDLLNVGVYDDYSYGETYHFPHERSFESHHENSYRTLTLTEMNEEIITEMMDQILANEITQLSELDSSDAVACFWADELSDGLRLTLRDIFSATPCTDCTSDSEARDGGLFWLVTENGAYNEFSRIRFTID